MNRDRSTTTPVRPAEVFPEPRVRGEGFFRFGERFFLWLDRVVSRLIPEERWNPFARTGAIAMTTFLIAAVTGVLLLFWYDASVTGAYDSVRAMGRSPWSAGLMRSLHRYSSDACLFIVTVHMLQVLFQRRFAGARWLAWVTGFLLIFLLWVVGWLGYWLVWDERGQLVATSTAEMTDVVPVFADPLSRSFLVDEEVNTLLFFMVFFVHMLLPLGMGVLMWLHIARVSRPRFLTDRVLTLWVSGSLVALSLLAPADLAEPANMTHDPAAFSMDAWYLAPLALAQRMSVGASWTALLAIGMAGMSVPWLLGRRARATPAVVEQSRCVSCLRCFQDCPYGAIAMIPRTDGRDDLPSQAHVDPMRCVGCGICTGSCDTAGVGVPRLPMLDARRRVRQWAEDAAGAGREEWLLVACGGSAAGELQVDEAGGRCAALPGWRVMPAPCAGWLQASVVEAALRHGLQGVMVMACGPGECHFREGVKWTEDRLGGRREPVLRADRVDLRRAEVVRLDRTRVAMVPAAAAAFQERVAALGGGARLPTRKLAPLSGYPALQPSAAGGLGAEFPSGSRSAPRGRRVRSAILGRGRWSGLSPLGGGGVVAQNGRISHSRGPASWWGRDRPRHLAGGALVAAVLTAITWAGSVVPWTSAHGDQPRLVVSFKHPGALVEPEDAPTEEELAGRPVHMRAQQGMTRERSPVRLRVLVDGELALERDFPPRGLWGDGNSIAVEDLPVSAGTHEVTVLLDEDPGAAGGWDYRAERALEFTPRNRRVVLFDRERGFTFHP